MNIKKQNRNFIKKQLESIKDMGIDLIPRLTNLLNPSVYQSPESLKIELGNIFTGFAASRIQKWLEEIKSVDIDENIVNSEKSTRAFLDLIQFITKKNPDTETWEAAKKIFANTLRKNTQEQERLSLYEQLKICQELNGTEIRILAGAYNLFKNYEETALNKNQYNVNSWATNIAKEIGFDTREEILRYEENLVKQRLISPREVLRGDILDTWVPNNSFGHRLTSLGIKLTKSMDQV